MFWNIFLGAFFSAKIFDYSMAKELEKMAMEIKERRKRIEGLEDVLTEEEKQILMDMD